ncbi:ATG12/APG12 [Novymonas esmeraldas]|uniref:ATG12/APG12 n=1 Tax=Novymonas esmeraldas TaxID=1808958 RepID=A0AAW0EWS6_9TRYP
MPSVAGRGGASAARQQSPPTSPPSSHSSSAPYVSPCERDDSTDDHNGGSSVVDHVQRPPHVDAHDFCAARAPTQLYDATERDPLPVSAPPLLPPVTTTAAAAAAAVQELQRPSASAPGWHERHLRPGQSSSLAAAPVVPIPAPRGPPPPPRTHYQYMHSFDYRCQLSRRMHGLYGSDTVPVIVEPTGNHVRAPPSSEERHSHAAASSGRPAGAKTSAASASATSVLTTPSTKSTLKCVLPCTKTVAELILTLRDRLALDSCQSLFLSVGHGDVLVPGNSLLGELYNRYRHLDGFLYLGYLLENTFGGDTNAGGDEVMSA